MDREQLLTRLESAWRDLQESYAGLSDSEIMKPGVTGQWSVRDILAHVTTWEQEALNHLPTILGGRKPPLYSVSHGGIDSFNRAMTEKKRDLTWADVCRDLEETHRRVHDFIGLVPEAQFRTETPFRRRLRLDTYSHYRLHALAIRNWRKKQLKGARESDPGTEKTDRD
ncbi:MAG: ClbS/DfsB family four-helix bundle protein [Acidobacteria bacterium]|nr:ClbS/DfsB family four-helix bundle protein [Acidobacteriota bacterium]